MDDDLYEMERLQGLEDGLEVVKIEDLPDGSSVYDINPSESFQQLNHNDNLANFLTESQRALIANDLLEGIQEDINSRQQWQAGYSEGIKYLGLAQDLSNSTSKIADVFDTTMLNALLRFCSTLMSELFPSTGIATFEVEGETNEALEQYGERQKNIINHYLKNIDTAYYKDTEKMSMPLGLGGNGFKKIFDDPIRKNVLSRFVKPENLIVNNQCNSLLESMRISEIYYLNKKDIVQRQNTGFFLDSGKISEYDEEELTDNQQVEKTIKDIDGLSDDYDKSSQFRYFESHAQLDYQCLLDLEQHEKIEHPLPYIVHICDQTKKVVAIYRGWEELDPEYNSENYYIHYAYFSGFGLYAYGLLHLLGNNSKALTILTRQQMDAQTIRNFPIYFLADTAKTEHTTIEMEPGEAIRIQTGGVPISEIVATIPFPPSDPNLQALMASIKGQTEQTGSIADLKLAETSPNAPVGTTVALLETQNKFQSSVMRSLYDSLTQELSLIYRKLVPIPQDPQELELYKRIKIIPACDPTFSTTMQRIIKSEAVFKYAQTNPAMHNMREVYRRVYLSIGVENIEELLMPEQKPMPLDPITENMNALNGKPLQAEMWQDHEAHLLTHMVFRESNPNLPPEIIGPLLAHERQHQAFMYLLQMQMAMGFRLPSDPQMLQNPEVQNEIATKAAEAAMAQKQAAEQQRPPEPTEVMMAEVEQKREAAHLKAQADEKHVELESFKSQLEFEKEMEKIKRQQEMAEDKNETALTIAEMQMVNKQESNDG